MISLETYNYMSKNWVLDKKIIAKFKETSRLFYLPCIFKQRVLKAFALIICRHHVLYTTCLSQFVL